MIGPVFAPSRGGTTVAEGRYIRRRCNPQIKTSSRATTADTVSAARIIASVCGSSGGDEPLCYSALTSTHTVVSGGRE